MVRKYESCKPFKWLVVTLFILFGFFGGFYIPNFIYMMGNGKYSREGLDELMKLYYGEYNVEDALSEEILIVAYEYNSQQPRFYSKYFAGQESGIYQIATGNATGASSSAPGYFTPKLNTNKFDIPEILIDGGLICNNPSLYAF